MEDLLDRSNLVAALANAQNVVLGCDRNAQDLSPFAFRIFDRGPTRDSF